MLLGVVESISLRFRSMGSVTSVIVTWLSMCLFTAIVAALADHWGLISRSSGNDFEGFVPKLLFAVLVAPILETFTSNVIVFHVFRRYKINQGLAFFCSWLVFAVLHTAHPLKFLTAGIFGGCVFAALFYAWSKESMAKAFFLVSVAHALYNGGIFAFAALLG